jgi:hypothetical protein
MNRMAVRQDGKFVIEAQFDLASSFSEGSAAVHLNDKWGFIESRASSSSPRKRTVWRFFQTVLRDWCRREPCHGRVVLCRQVGLW